MRACNLSSTTIVLLISSCCIAQEFDLLPDVQPSPHAMRAVTFATGLPVESEMQTEVFTQRVGPTDLAVIPGSTQFVVSNYGGAAIRFDERGNRIGTFLDLGNANSPTFSSSFDVGGRSRIHFDRIPSRFLRRWRSGLWKVLYDRIREG